MSLVTESLPLNNIPFCTIFVVSDFLIHQVGFAHQSLSQSILRPLRNYGDAPVFAMILSGGLPQPRDLAPEADNDEDDDDSLTLEPKLLSSIELACMPGVLHLIGMKYIC